MYAANTVTKGRDALRVMGVCYLFFIYSKEEELMGLRVNTNVASLTSQRNLGMVSGRLQGNFARLSSGLRISSAADDAAGLGISERMRSQIRSYGTAGRNAQDGISMVQTAEGALNEVSSLLGRMRELAVQASNGTLSTADRTTINTEFQAIDDEINRVGGQTEFNGISLLNAASTTSIQVGIDANQTIDVVTADMQSAALSIDTLDTTSSANANAAITALDAAIDSVSTQRGTFGSSINRLQSAHNSIMNAHENLSAAESRIRDVDVAFETADLSRNTIMQQAATSILAQANQQPQLALSLLG
jgi:flagellin